jgi:hypothetical protein
MDQQNQERGPSLNLPTPQLEMPQVHPEQSSGGLENVSEKSSSQAIERGVASQQQPQVSGVSSQTSVNPHGVPPQQASSTSSQAVSVGTPHIADDIDLIEKEWVVKAKEIVAKTKDDPYRQNQEMSKVKADYLKKRYNKDLRLSEDT